MTTARGVGLAALVCMGGFQALEAQAVPDLDPSVQAVLTGGYWSTPEADGVFRVIVQRGGWEHVASRVLVQWLVRDEEARGLRVVETAVLVDPETDGPWSFDSPELVTRSGGIDVVLTGTHTHALSEGEFVFSVDSPGRVRVVKRGL